MLKKYSFIVLAACVMMSQTPSSAVVRESPVKEAYTKMEQYITMRDGVRLFTSIYLPKESSEKHPILLQRTPYSVAPYGVDKYKMSIGPSSSFAGESYIVVYQDVRGRWNSEGVFVDMNPVKVKKARKESDETTDTFDTIEWLVKNLPNNNGRVGMWGISWPGHFTAQGMLSNHPALKAVSPQAPMIDLWEGDDAYHLGAFQLTANYSFFLRFGGYRPKPITEAPKPIDVGNPDGYDFYLNAKTFSNLTEILGEQAVYWNAYIGHDTYDSYWQARNLRPHFKNISPAVLTVGGWFDGEDLLGPLATFATLNKQSSKTSNRLVMGPWTHGQWARGNGETRIGNAWFGSDTSKWFQETIELPFFNYYLKSKGSFSAGAATMFETGTNRWRTFDAWPPSSAKSSTLYFHPEGRLESGLSSGGSAESTEWISDPNKPVPYTMDISLGYSRNYMTEDQRFASSRPDVIVFQTDALSEDLTISGPLDVKLFASTTGTDSDFIIKIIDVHPNDYKTPAESPSNWKAGGYQMLVRGDTLRGKFRDSFSNPKPFTPNQPTEVGFKLQDIFHTFRKGHRLMIHVQASWFPIVDRNPQQFMTIRDAKPEDFKKATLRLYHTKDRPSQINFLKLENQ